MTDNGTLRCAGVSKRFDGVTALSNVTVEFPNSAISAIVGPNGAGKSTLLNVITGFLRPDSGKCFLGDVEITSLPPFGVTKAGVCRTFQDARLAPSLSVLENVLLAIPDQPSEGVLRALLFSNRSATTTNAIIEASSILKRIDMLHLRAVVAGELSYGQQKLLSIACSLATGARILLFDEPVAGIHRDLITKMASLFKELRTEGRSIVLVEHDMSFVRNVADFVLALDGGTVVKAGDCNFVFGRDNLT